MENIDLHFMKQALEEARLAFRSGEVPVGAVIVCGGRLVGKGRNMCELLHDPTSHAEMIATTAATAALGGKYLEDCTLYVTVEPCPMCAAALNWAQLGRLVYGASDPRRGYSLFSPSLLHPRTEVSSGILAEESARLMKDFFQGKR